MRPVDSDLVARFVLREVTEAEAAEVKRLVAEDPAWARELREQALLDVHLHEAFEQRKEARPVASPTPWWARLRRWWPVVVPTLALAAALLWVGEPAPTYELEVHGGESTLRATSAPTLRYTRGSSLDLVLRAAAPTTVLPEVVVLLDGAPLEGLEVRQVEGGSVELQGVFGEEIAEPSPGPHLLVVRVAGVEHTRDLVWEPQ